MQAVVLPVADRHLDYARRVSGELAGVRLRAEVNDRAESVGKKIRDAEARKVPYMLVVGDREEEAGEVSVRRRGAGNQGAERIADFVERAAQEIEKRAAPLPA